MEPIDLVAFAPHPDDAELLGGGTLAITADRGHRTAIVDLTRGETATRGTPELRASEAAEAARILGLAHRECLGLPDAALADVTEQRETVVACLRRLRPRAVILPWRRGRHPDHAAAAALVRSACFLAGLAGFAPGTDPPHKPTKILWATAFRDHDSVPRLVVDITAGFERKMAAIAAYESQFEGRDQGGEMFPTGRPFLESVAQRFAHYGSLIQSPYGEPFHTDEPIATSDVLSLGVLSI